MTGDFSKIVAMSVQSLPLLVNGSSSAMAPPPRVKENGNGIVAGKRSKKFFTLPTKKKVVALERQPSVFDEALQKRQRLNRNGSIGHLQFRGIKKEFLQKQTSMILHSMTVGYSYRGGCLLVKLVDII